MAKATLASDGTEIPAGTPGKITEVQDRRVTVSLAAAGLCHLNSVFALSRT